MHLSENTAHSRRRGGASGDTIALSGQQKAQLTMPAPAGEDIPVRRSVVAPRGELLKQSYREVFEKLFMPRGDGATMMLYHHEVEELAKSYSIEPSALIERAVGELRDYGGIVQSDARGRIVNHKDIGEHFSALLKLVSKKVDLFIIHHPEQLYAKEFPLSASYSKALRGILAAHESAILMLVRHPPKEAVDEIVQVAKDHLGGVMSLWAKPEYRERLPLSEKLQRYLSFATVRLMTTGNNPEAEAIARKVNEQLEGKGGFEDKHWVRVVKQISLNEQHHALKESMIVCGPVLVAIQALDKFAPALMHTVGGALDDIFGSVGPNIYQSFRKAGLTLKQKFMEAKSAIALGAVSIPISAGMGHWAAQLFTQATTPGARVQAGVIFALACSIGTVLSSMGAVYDVAGKLKALEASPTVGHLVSGNSPLRRWWGAFNEAILNVPFRIGHTIVGVGCQVGLGVAAGLLGFFNNKWFVAGEGMLESIMGIVLALSYPAIAKLIHERKLKAAEFRDDSVTA